MERPIPPGETKMLEGVMVAVGMDPVVLEVGETVVENETLPENRLNVSSVMVELPDWPVSTLNLSEVAVRLKSAGVFEILHAVRGCSSQPEKL